MPKSKKSTAERLADLDAQLLQAEQKRKQLEARKKELEAKEKAERRKADAHRKIEVGASVESVCHLTIEKEDLPILLRFLHDVENAGFFFSSAMGYDHRKEQAEDGSMKIVYEKKETGHSPKTAISRLIKVGQMVESICGVQIEGNDLKMLQAFLLDAEAHEHIFSRAMGYSCKEEQRKDGSNQVTYYKPDTKEE